MARFSDILRGQDLAQAFTKYQQHQAKSREARSAAHKAARSGGRTTNQKYPRETGAVKPFNYGTDTLLFDTKLIALTGAAAGAGAATGPADDSRDLVAALAAPYSYTNAEASNLAGAIRVRIPNYRLARVLATSRTGTPTPKNSRMTDLPYQQYTTYTASTPFGRKEGAAGAGPDTFAEAVKTMKATADYTAFLAKEGYRVSFIPERG